MLSQRLAEEELTFQFKSFTHFRDLEVVGHQMQVDPKSIKSSYLDAVGRFVSRIESGCGQMKADYVPMSTKEPFDLALADYLARGRRVR